MEGLWRRCPKTAPWESPTGDNSCYVGKYAGELGVQDSLDGQNTGQTPSVEKLLLRVWCLRVTGFLSLPPLERVRKYIVTLSWSDVLSNSIFTA